MKFVPLRTATFCSFLMALLAAGSHRALAASTVFTTGFEATEGYDQQLTLFGQNGWEIFGNGGNGILTTFFEGEGQQAFIGFVGPTNADVTLSIWQPLNFTPLATNLPIVTFSVLMGISASSTTNRDDFRWSVYNIDGKRMFSLDFDGTEHSINYALEDGREFISTGSPPFENFPVLYDLVIAMNFARNLWSASMNNLPIVSNQPITTTNSVLNLGDVDAVWSIRTAGAAGDGYMIFDNYQITAQALPSMPPTLETVAVLPNGQFLLRLHGEPRLNYAIEATTNFDLWIPLKTNSAPDGVSEFLDMRAAELPYRFYRAREVSP